MDYDQTTMPAAYDAGRGYDPATLKLWLDVVASVAPEKVEHILDLGCGTGRYSAALAARFGAEVTALDPSEKMLAQAARKGGEGVRYVRGSGEAVPLPDDAVDMVFISMVFHHFASPLGAARECHRVLTDGGVVCLRAGTSERTDDYPYVPFFPRTRTLIAKDLQSLAVIEETFLVAGFALVRHDVVQSEVGASWAAYADRLAYRANSILAQLTDREFEDGMAALRDFAAAAPPEQRVIEPVDFFAFRRI